MVEELLAIVKCLPDGTVLEDPMERGVYGVPVKVIRDRLKEILCQLVIGQELLN